MNGYCFSIHYDWRKYVVYCCHDTQVSTPPIDTISIAPCVGVHLSQPLVSQTKWRSSSVTLCSGIPVTGPPFPCTLVYFLRLFWELRPSIPIFIEEMKFDRLLRSHHSTCQRVLLYLPLPLWLTLVKELRQNTKGKQPVSYTQGQECCSNSV